MTPRQSRQTAGQSLPDSLRNCLSFDIEVSRQSGQIVAAAACNPQTGQTWRARGPLTKQELLEFDRMAAEADHLVGHNILAFDLPQLRALHAGLGLLDSPPLGHPGIRRPQLSNRSGSAAWSGTSGEPARIIDGTGRSS